MALPLRRLYLLRHAKSSWTDPSLDDHARPLAPRGEEAVRRLRRHLARRQEEAPELVLCSSARRTTMTLDGIAAALPARTDTRIEDGLYAASSGRLLERLRDVADEVSRVMVIGHNPGLEDLALLLVAQTDDAVSRRMAAKFPTGALATLTFAGSWADLAPGTATLESFVVPRETLTRTPSAITIQPRARRRSTVRSDGHRDPRDHRRRGGRLPPRRPGRVR